MRTIPEVVEDIKNILNDAERRQNGETLVDIDELANEILTINAENEEPVFVEFNNEEKINIVTVRWWDGYKEDFRATEVRFGSDLLWMRLEDGNNRHIPLRMVRWFGTSIESHQNTGM